MATTSAGLTKAKLYRMRQKHGGAQLQSGMSSLLFVTAPRGREAQAVQELYSMLPEYVEVAATMAKDTDTRATSGEGKDGDDEADEEADEDEAAEEEAEEEEDLEAMMQKELNELRDPQKYKKNEAIVSIPIDVECVVVLKLPARKDPVDVVLRIMNDVASTKRLKTRYCLRFTPITRTCKATMEDLEKLATSVLAPHFLTEPKTPTSFMVVYSARNSNSLVRDEVIKMLANCVGQGHKVDLTQPEKVILVEAYKSVAGISVVTDFQRFKKFNVSQLVDPIPSAKKRAKDDESEAPSAKKADVDVLSKEKKQRRKEGGDDVQ